MRGLEARAREPFSRRLLTASPRPIAVALSGGGDSLALTLIADAWAREYARSLLILTVDHRLQAASSAWTAACAATAERLGWAFRALAWTGAKPATGLPAAARRARHALIADAAREAGARVVLMGHTADDLAEAGAMRAEGSTLSDAREWAPSPAWPEGRGVFVLRPLLDLRRAELRAWLSARGETWIDDPANADQRYARSRARARRAEPRSRDEPPPLALASEASEAAGVIRVSRTALRVASIAEVRRFTALAAVSAGGGDRLPAGVRVERLAAHLRGDAPVDATLSGARIQAEGGEILFFREAGEAARGGLAPTCLPGVWDGRFELAGPGEACRLAGLAARLPKPQQAALRDIPAAARGALPAIVTEDGAVSSPALEGAASLVGARFRAAAGLVSCEAP